MKNSLKLFVWEEVLSDSIDSVMFALAESKEDAIAIILDKAKGGDTPVGKHSTQFWIRKIRWMKKGLEEHEPQIYDAPAGFFLFGAELE